MLALYTAMVKFRRIAAEAGPGVSRTQGTAAVTGWEATLAGVTSDLVEGDQLSAASSSAVSRVVDALRRKAKDQGTLELRGEAGGDGEDEFDIACRRARGFKSTGEGKVAVHLCTGPARPGAWPGRLAQVARHGLPLLIVCCGPALDAGDPVLGLPASLRTKPAARISGVPLITVDGSDVCAVYRVASESIFRARHGRGPTLIACVTLPDAGTVGLLPERDQALPHDPILSMETYLTRRRILTKAVKGKIDSGLGGETDPAPALRVQ